MGAIFANAPIQPTVAAIRSEKSFSMRPANTAAMANARQRTSGRSTTSDEPTLNPPLRYVAFDFSRAEPVPTSNSK